MPTSRAVLVYVCFILHVESVLNPQKPFYKPPPHTRRLYRKKTDLERSDTGSGKYATGDSKWVLWRQSEATFRDNCAYYYRKQNHLLRYQVLSARQTTKNGYNMLRRLETYIIVHGASKDKLAS